MKYKVIITGAHGLVGDAVLTQALESQFISEILSISCSSTSIKHPKLKELIATDFLELTSHESELTGYDACFYCLQMPDTSVDETVYSYFTIDMALSIASALLELNPNLVFSFLSRLDADTTEQSDDIAAKITGRAENALGNLLFKKLYFFRAGAVSPGPRQQVSLYRKLVYLFHPLMEAFMADKINTAPEIGLAMINALLLEYPEQVIKPKDIKTLARHRKGLA
jgi:hypothetical protein